jgi:hypothetical protein
MDPLLTKLNYKDGQTLVVHHPPVDFMQHLKTIHPDNVVVFDKNIIQSIEFIIVFTTIRAEAEELLKSIVPCLRGDAVYWLAYPKGTSKKYSCDFNRNTSREICKPYQLLPIRQIAVDDDWSALRFRKKEYIKSIVRKQQ